MVRKFFVENFINSGFSGLKKHNNAEKQIILSTNKELKELHDKLISITLAK